MMCDWPFPTISLFQSCHVFGGVICPWLMVQCMCGTLGHAWCMNLSHSVIGTHDKQGHFLDIFAEKE